MSKKPVSLKNRAATGDGTTAAPGGWTFDATVASAFDAHVAVSVPGYDDLQALVGRLAAFYLVDGGTVVDWGCATGRTVREMMRANPLRRVRYLGIDESADMVRVATHAREQCVTAGTAEFRALEIAHAPPPRGTCLVVALYTLQFLPPARRWEALRAAFDGLESGGALIVSEKVAPDDTELANPWQEILWHEKRERGHEPQAILAKARSLEGVLRPVSAARFEEQLAEVGFRATRFWQHLSFAAWIAVKP